MKIKHFYPLAGFVIPSLVIGYGFVIPHSCIAGWNALSIGFATTLLGASIAYWTGVRQAVAGTNTGGQPDAAS